MPKWEFCRSEYESRELKGFLSGHQGIMMKVVVVVDTPVGKKAIRETSEF
jgi:ribosomal protein S2